MARAAKTTKSGTSGRKTAPSGLATKPRAKPAKTARSAAPVQAAAGRRTPASAAKSATPAVTTAKARTPAAPSVSKDELRSQIEALQRLVATLRTRSRDANRSAKSAAARIAELEEQVARQTATASAPDAAEAAGEATPSQAGRGSRDVDPGDAVPPGVAVREPAPLDEEAETALENLQEHLGH